MRDHWKKFYHRMRQFFTGHYNLLLTFLWILFAFRPYEHGGVYVGIWKICLTAVLLLAIFNVHHVKNERITIAILAIPSLILTWISVFSSMHWITPALALSNVLFMGICARSILYNVITRARVTLASLRGAVSAYFLIAFIFAYLYLFIEALRPGSISIGDKIIDVFANPHHYFSLMLYFSLVTLLTVGYGDIVCIRDFSQTACVMEGIIGQFYIAILVARLVSVYSLLSNKKFLASLQGIKK